MNCEPKEWKGAAPAIAQTCRHCRGPIPVTMQLDIPGWGLEYYIKCPMCFCSGPRRDSLKVAIEQWNLQNRGVEQSLKSNVEN